MDTQAKMNKPQVDDEISLWDIVNFLKEGWCWLAGGMLVGLVCAVTYLAVTPQQYEAQALFQGARVLGLELEGSAQLIERLKFPTFYGTKQLKACDISTDSPTALLAQRINPMVLKGTNLLQVTYRARKSAQAVQCLEAVIEQVIGDAYGECQEAIGIDQGSVG